MDHSSSNYRELKNAVDGLESEGTASRLTGVGVFLLGDNSVAEETYYKGSSASRLIHQEVLRLQKLKI
eukprot:10639697-Ditylum_brightwellii.AAC.1